jgi:hypothetical protein
LFGSWLYRIKSCLFLFLVSGFDFVTFIKKSEKNFYEVSIFLHCIFVIPQLFFYKSDPSCVLKNYNKCWVCWYQIYWTRQPRNRVIWKFIIKISGCLTNFDNLSHKIVWLTKYLWFRKLRH